VTAGFLEHLGSLAGIIVLIKDVTGEHRRHEREKVMLRRFGRLQRERARGLMSLADSVAHQVRNPVTAIAGMARLAEGKCGADDPRLQYLEAIQEEAAKLERMVDAVATVTALPRAVAVPVSLKTIVDSAREAVEPVERELGCRVRWDLRVHDIRIRADAGLLGQALQEIYVNAMDFCPRNEVSISVTAQEVGEGLRLRISDNGPGILPEHLPQVFDPFFTSKPDGVGMGLTRVKRIVNEHGGEIGVADGPGGGAVFTITLPEDLPPDD
jgi:signal transduction histidine kinase